MKVTVLSVGKIRDPFLERMIAAYMSRMSPNHKVAWESVPEVRGETRKEVVLEKEGLLLEKFFRERDRCVLLDESGDHFKSTEFARWIQNETTTCPGRLIFVIGGPFGVSADLHERASKKLALSRMTFPHDLCVLILMEQLYRAFSILAGTAYHH